jgi:Major Facilitator Superfamily
VFIIIYALGNFLGPLTLGRLFDTIGRKPMIAVTYLGSAAVSVVLAVLFNSGSLTSGSFIALVVVVFFLASAGASAAYLTASEIFPMETRALAIAFFFAIGTAVGGITGPLLFGKLIATGHEGQVAIGFLIGAMVMALGGVAELLFGVKAAGEQLEDIAKPLTAQDAERDRPADADATGRDEMEPEPPAHRAAARHAREQRLRRFRPGPGRMPTSRVPAVTSLVPEPRSTTRSMPSSTSSTNMAPPTAESWPGWWEPATGARACSAQRYTRRSPRAPFGGCRVPPLRRPTAVAAAMIA